jgi:hypothetical protein
VVSASGKRESRSPPNAGLVTFEYRAYNRSDMLVRQARRTALILKEGA